MKPPTEDEIRGEMREKVIALCPKLRDLDAFMHKTVGSAFEASLLALMFVMDLAEKNDSPPVQTVDRSAVMLSLVMKKAATKEGP